MFDMFLVVTYIYASFPHNYIVFPFKFLESREYFLYVIYYRMMESGKQMKILNLKLIHLNTFLNSVELY